MIAVYYGIDIKQDRLTLILNYWSDAEIDINLIIYAYDKYAKESKINKFPSPADIMDLINPKLDAHDIGVLTAAKILEAIRKFGSYSSKEAHEYIGDAGWACVKVFGGWVYICEHLGINVDITAFQAQCREIVKSENKISDILGAECLSLSSKSENPQLPKSNQDNINKLSKLLNPKQIN